MIITIRTDKPEAEVGVYDSDSYEQRSYVVWYAHRELATTLLGVVRDELKKVGSGFEDITGIVVYQGPGSFTGLRIGITVANTFAYGLHVPIVGEIGEENWLERGLDDLRNNRDDQMVLPHYGAEAHITQPRK